MRTAPSLAPSQQPAVNAATLRRQGLRKPPFATVADADSRYSDLALDMPVKILLSHLRNHKWLLVLSGDHGVGKSTQLLRLLAAGANDLLFCAFKARPEAHFAAIEQTIRQRWAKPVQRHATSTLTDLLCNLCHGQRRPVLVVDDAHQLKSEVLSALLQLGHTVQRQCGRTPGIVLAGEAYLETLLERSAERHIPLQTRITITLQPLTPEQTEAYLRLRLQTAGAKDPDLLSGEVAEAIYRESQGYPLKINAAANRYLLGPETPDESCAIEQQDDKTANLTPDTSAPRKTNQPHWRLPTAVGILTTITATGALYLTLQNDSLSFNPREVISSLTGSSLPEPTPEPLVSWPQTVSPEPQPIVVTDETSPAEPEPIVEASPEPEPVAEASPEPEPVAEASPDPEPVAEASPELEPVAEISPELESTTSVTTEAPAATMGIDATALDRTPVPTGSLLGEAWLQQQNPNHFTIQIAASNDRQALRQYAESLDLNTERAWFRSLRNEQDWYSLVVGQYPSSASAQTAIANLPVRVRRNQPWIRNFGSIQRDINNAQ